MQAGHDPHMRMRALLCHPSCVCDVECSAPGHCGWTVISSIPRSATSVMKRGNHFLKQCWIANETLFLLFSGKQHVRIGVERCDTSNLPLIKLTSCRTSQMSLCGSYGKIHMVGCLSLFAGSNERSKFKMRAPSVL